MNSDFSLLPPFFSGCICMKKMRGVFFLPYLLSYIYKLKNKKIINTK